MWDDFVDNIWGVHDVVSFFLVALIARYGVEDHDPIIISFENLM
jgi:hypothetical protein